MTERRHLPSTIVALGLLLCASAVHAGIDIDLASEGAPSIHGTSAEEQFGYCTAVGDLDGDGLAELVVGAPGRADSTGTAHTGAVFVFSVSALGALSTDAGDATLAEWTITGSSARSRFGSALTVGDLDGDGFDDLAVGASVAGDDSAIARGEVSVYFGGPGRAWSNGAHAVPDIVLMGSSPGARLGSSMLARDVDDDGTAELLISESGGGEAKGARPAAVYVVRGEALRSLHGSAAVSDMAASSVSGENTAGALAGLAVTDTDGDGILELALGAPQADGPGGKLPDAGKLYIVPVPKILEERSAPLPLAGAVAMCGLTERGFLGRSLSAGDIDFDGIDDLLVSAYASRAHRKKLEATGEMFVLFGDPHGGSEGQESVVAGASTLDDAAVPRFHGRSKSDLFGLPVLLADLNGDGSNDIIAASQYADGPGNDRNTCGEVYVYWGSVRSVIAAKAGSAELADVTVAGESPEDAIGASLLVVEITEGEPPTLVIGAPNAPGVDDEGATIQRRGKLILLSGRSLRR
ncbi:MAG: integrin alpha [Candidatus Eisenbacteria bacterium]|nr:integrin alpha [Candidatus Eisenbacteria bacterium]